MKAPHRGRQDKVSREQTASQAMPDERLVWDCATVGRMLASDQPPATARLAAMLGKDLTRVLLITLTADPTDQSSISKKDAA